MNNLYGSLTPYFRNEILTLILAFACVSVVLKNSKEANEELKGIIEAWERPDRKIPEERVHSLVKLKYWG